MKRKSKQKGFTLVELIVVIVIILILAALLIPFLLRYVEKAKEANCRSGMSSLLTEYSAGVAEGAIDPDKDQDIGDLRRPALYPIFPAPATGNSISSRIRMESSRSGVHTTTMARKIPEVPANSPDPIHLKNFRNLSRRIGPGKG